MYIKNISQILNFKGDERLNLSKGNVVSGKVLSLTDGKGVVQLQNGAILPSVFLLNNNIEENTSYKFKVQEYSKDRIVLEVASNDEKPSQKESDINRILQSLNISKSDGAEIIAKLIKFNIPATDENILNLNNNFNFLKEIKNLSDTELLSLLKNITGKEVSLDSKEFLAIKAALATLQNVDLDFLTFLEQNKIPANLENILKLNDFLKNPLVINDFITKSSENLKENLSLNIKDIPKETINNLCKELNITPTTLKDVLNFIKENNINLNNISSEDKIKILSFISSNEGTLPIDTKEKSLDGFLNSLKNLSMLKGIASNDTGYIDNLVKNIRNNYGINISAASIGEISLSIKENPSLIETLKSSLNSEGDFLKLCQTILKNPSLNSSSSEVLLLKQLSMGNMLDDFNSINYSKIDKLESLIFKSILDNMSSNTKDMAQAKLLSLGNALGNIKDNPEALSKIPQFMLSLLNDNLDISKHLCNNYTLLNFNYLLEENLYKNNIIIKNKYSSKYIDIDDVKLYISVDTKNIGTVEGYVSKKFKDLFLNLKVDEKHIINTQKSIYKLENKLKDMGLNVVNISIEKKINNDDILSLSNFFGNITFSDLDVRV